jgi:hypothetical protein
MAFGDIAALPFRMRRHNAGARDTVCTCSLAVVIKAPSSTVSELSSNRKKRCRAGIFCILLFGKAERRSRSIHRDI